MMSNVNEISLFNKKEDFIVKYKSPWIWVTMLK